MLMALPSQQAQKADSSSLFKRYETVKFSEISDFKRFIFSDLNGYVLFSLKANKLGPKTAKASFLELPRHGAILRSPVLSLRSYAATGRDWGEILRLFGELHLADLQGPVLLEGPDEEVWQLSGRISRHPDGVLLEQLEADEPGQRKSLLMSFDPKKQRLSINSLNLAKQQNI
jgi:hypothetical protein